MALAWNSLNHIKDYRMDIKKIKKDLEKRKFIKW